MEVDADSNASSEEEIRAAPSLYTRSTFYRPTMKRGKILKTVTERYLRDDLGFGCYYEDTNNDDRIDRVHGTPKIIDSVTELRRLLQPSSPPSLVVCDANVMLHNMDILQQSGKAMPNIVVPQTALDECRANRMVIYDQTVDLLRSVGTGRCTIFFPDPYHTETATEEEKGMSPNDINDERIRRVAEFYGKTLKGSDIQVIFLTDDVASRQKSDSRYYKAMSVRRWVQILETKNPGMSLLDLVAHASVAEQTVNESAALFETHLESNALSRGIQSGTLYRGVLRSSDWNLAYVTIRRGEERVAVTIQGDQDRNRAVDGDVVAISLHPLSNWIHSASSKTDATVVQEKSTGIASETAEPTLADMSNVRDTIAVDDTHGELRPTGKVVGIVRRNFENQSGSIFTKSTKGADSQQEKIAAQFERENPDGTATCVFFPVNKKIPPILLRTTQRDRLFGQRIVVSLDSWPANSLYPLGHYVRTIGPTGDKDVETEVLLQQHDIPHEPFPAAVLACLPPENYKISAENSPGRVDLRHLPVLSIDPPGCKDIDDALHCLVLPNGNYQVGVHIADVTHYVKPGTAMDLEAANRSTSTYLVNKRLDMLPALLTTDLCSLKCNVDRYAFSVLWEVAPDGNIIQVDFQKSIIHSIAALTYQQAQSFIDQPDDPTDIQACAVKRLAVLARKFRQRRVDAGALTLASPEVKFVLDSESLNPTDVQAYALLEANALVEEFMLLANVTVAKRILRQYPTLSVLRRHPAPNRSMFDPLISKAQSIGLSINIDDSKKLADSLDAAQVESDPYINILLRILSTRCMSPAQYFCSGELRASEWHHYGLAAPVYTHFTSPIRRYADVCVHRLLAASINVAPLPQHLSSKTYMHDLCANMNRRHRAAQLAGRASVQLHTLIYFSGDGAKEEDAYVLDVDTDEGSDPSFTVMVPRYGIEGRVRLEVTEAERYPKEHRISWDANGKTRSIKVFDKLRVRVSVREMQGDQRELVIELI